MTQARTGNWWVVMQFGQGGKPLAVWTKRQRMAERGADFADVEVFYDEDEAWKRMFDNHAAGQIWGVVPGDRLARKLQKEWR